MKIQLRIALLTGVLLFTGLKMDGFAQSEDQALNMQIEFNRGSYDMLVQRAGERGVSASDLAAWITESGNVYLKIEGVRGETVPREGILSVFIVGENGIIGQNGYPVQLTERPTAIGRFVGAGQIGRLLSSTFPGDTLFPSETFFPSDTFFPSETFIASSRDAERLAADAGRRAIGSGGGGGSGKVSVVMILIPDQFHPDLPVISKPVSVVGSVR